MHRTHPQHPPPGAETQLVAPFVAIRGHAEGRLRETRTRIDEAQQAVESTADTVERARRFLQEYWTRRNPGSTCDPGANSTTVDLHLQSFARSVDGVVACLHDAIRSSARDYEAVNQLDRRLPRLANDE